MGVPIMRCDSTTDLYPLPTSLTQPIIAPSTFVVISPTLWHNHFGHLRISVLHSLRNSYFIDGKQLSSSVVCQSYIFGNMLNCYFLIVRIALI